MATLRTPQESIMQALARIAQDDLDLEAEAAKLVLTYLGIDGYTVIEAERLDAVMRMLIDNGDMTPMAVRQIKLSLGLIPASEEVG